MIDARDMFQFAVEPVIHLAAVVGTEAHCEGVIEAGESEPRAAARIVAIDMRTAITCVILSCVVHCVPRSCFRAIG